MNILIVEVNWLLAYWGIAKEYNESFVDKYGGNFFEQTKEFLKVKNLTNNTEEIIEIKESTNNYYIKFNYSDSIYQVELLRLGKDDGKDYGYRLVSNEIHSPNIKVRIDDYFEDKIKFRNVKAGEEEEETKFYKKTKFSKDDIVKLYDETMRPAWNAYKKENGYKEK